MGMQMFGGSLRRHCAYISPFNDTQIEFTDEFCAPVGSGWGLKCEDKTDALPPVVYQCLDDDDNQTDDKPLGYQPGCIPLDTARINCVMDSAGAGAGAGVDSSPMYGCCMASTIKEVIMTKIHPIANIDNPVCNFF